MSRRNVKKHSAQEEDAEINITPMLDIVFILLIFFIVTTSFVKETGIDPDRPTAQTTNVVDKGNILIGINAQGKIWMQKRQVDLREVRALVESSLAESPGSSAVIIADQKSTTGVMIDLMDQIRLGGVKNISVSANKP